MPNEELRVPKRSQHVGLWVHPAGRVTGSVYLHLQSNEHTGQERPEDLLNQKEPFLVFKCDTPNELRFYSKKAIIRLQYSDEQPEASTPMMTFSARLHMMDGSTVAGEIKDFPSRGRRRLFDYINKNSEAFIKLHLRTGDVCLINKDYIVHVSAAQGTLP
jgi:hypothetical protein